MMVFRGRFSGENGPRCSSCLFNQKPKPTLTFPDQSEAQHTRKASTCI